MRKWEVMGKIFGIAFVFVMMGDAWYNQSDVR